jgi:hypothetical protein
MNVYSDYFGEDRSQMDSTSFFACLSSFIKAYQLCEQSKPTIRKTVR